MDNPTLRIVSDPHEMKAMRESWNELLKNSSSDTPFLTWEWMYTWWECFGDGKTPCIVVAEDQGALVGIAPLYITRGRFFGLRSLRHLEFIGSAGVITEYQDFIIRRGREREIVSYFLEFLFDNVRKWDVINLTSVRKESVNLEEVRVYCDAAHVPFWEYQSNVSPYIELNGSLDDFMKTLSQTSRYKFRNHLKKLEKGRTVKMCETMDKKSVENDFATIIELHQKRWEQKGGPGSFARYREGYLRFHNTIIQRFFDNGWLYLLRLLVDGTPAAGHYSFFYNGVVYNHSIGFDPRWSNFRVGSVLQLLALEDCTQKGAKEFDFLRGTEEYKYIWTKKEHLSVDTVIWRSRAKARWATLERKTRKTLKSLFPKAMVEKIYHRLMNREYE
ncbi:MAG TPA: GNAT family N-acetyltransferase [Syntrophorhabdaceae bacterium]|nr:GNAT family N-acetyltransferase [Syntrophorhabdaceae bacterium]